ncbi:hypothetical protein P3W85_33620 [Cupriavidus basilensis]|uniref:Uncharacterized protein n=1 Tax=Cupriavidus basilensis TaxID=68895 RepID=A0ABT6AYZ8_9BURK|nr:hypothetical protein [Cupriavidus basilensis]MDF3837839.1 hypothetical protein [Cupriavidus basilensis]
MVAAAILSSVLSTPALAKETFNVFTDGLKAGAFDLYIDAAKPAPLIWHPFLRCHPATSIAPSLGARIAVARAHSGRNDQTLELAD